MALSALSAVLGLGWVAQAAFPEAVTVSEVHQDYADGLRV